MKTSTLLLSLTLSLVAAGCIDTKDVGVESDASSGGSTSEGSGVSGASDSASKSGTSVDTVTASGTATATMTGPTGAGSDSSTGPSAFSSGMGSDSGSDTEVGSSTSYSGGDTDDSGDAGLCEDSGGIWDLNSCGHYTCGLPPECAAIVPGCDCGIFDNFLPKVGCFPSVECEPLEFPCGDATCLAGAEYCDVTVPGPKGPTIYECADVPKACAEDYTCGCLDAEGLVEPGECVQGDDLGITVTVAKP